MFPYLRPTLYITPTAKNNRNLSGCALTCLHEAIRQVAIDESFTSWTELDLAVRFSPLTQGFEFKAWPTRITQFRSLMPAMYGGSSLNKHRHISRPQNTCTNQQQPHRVGAVPDPDWVGSKWLLAFPKVPVTPAPPSRKLFFCRAAL